MSTFSEQVEALQYHLRTIAPVEILQKTEKFDHIDADMIAMMLEQAARFSEEHLESLASRGDAQGCRLEQGKVQLPPGTREVYQQWCELGFSSLSLPMDQDGMDFPVSVQSAIQEVLDAANMAFGMLCINLRCATRTLLQHAEPALVERWLPELVSGAASSTIVISEPQAGSDAGRIRTAAQLDEDGHWLINGSKIWISYGDHDATDQIVHLVLARTPGGEPGTRGLGLFAVPKYLNDAVDENSRNPIQVQRLEHKMGLHASPTCVLEFDNARAWLIGKPGQGIRNLFVMMNAMRLAVAVQGAAVANAATLHALRYARERPQGGAPDRPPVMIIKHADVKRMLLEMSSRAELLRALALRTAFFLDLAESSDDAQQASTHRKIAELLLPVAKTLSAEVGFEIASQGIQVLGGYGYTSDYPLERMARDIRVASIYEGTSGIQALDFVLRKVCRDQAATLQDVLQRIEQSLSRADQDNPLKAPLTHSLASFRQVLAQLLEMNAQQPGLAQTNAYGFLRLTGLLLYGWCALDLYAGINQETDYLKRLRVSLQWFASQYESEFTVLAARAGQDFDLSLLEL